MAKNKVKNSKIGGEVSQSSDVEETENIAESIEATKLSQKIISQTEGLQIGDKYKATGRYAVVCLLIIAVVYILVKFL